MEELIKIQTELKAPKGQYNSYGGYKYRSCEDILEAVKPLLAKYNCYLNISDEIVLIGDRYYVKATATLTRCEDSMYFSATAYAREEETKKGMDASQITGSASSYARKYALNGLLAIDDTKDADATNTHGKEEEQPQPQPQPQAKPRNAKAAPAQPVAEFDDEMRKLISECTSSEAVSAIWYANKNLWTNEEFKALIKEKGTTLRDKEKNHETK